MALKHKEIQRFPNLPKFPCATTTLVIESGVHWDLFDHLVSNLELLYSLSEQLQSRWVRWAIDNFGTDPLHLGEDHPFHQSYQFRAQIFEDIQQVVALYATRYWF